MDTNSRMKEISKNLRRDVKDLLGESANIVTNFFKSGLCTVKGAATHWKNFTHGITGAVSSLFKSTREPPLADLSPEQEPIVTIVESTDENLPVRTRMTLSEAEERIATLNLECWDSDEPERPVKVMIDYMMDNEVDRYYLPLNIGPGRGSMLEQMQQNVESCLSDPQDTMLPFYDAPTGLAELLHEKFGPQFQHDLERLSTRVLVFFQQHYTITKLGQQFETQAMVMPEKDKKNFLQYTKTTTLELRKATNTSQITAPAQERTISIAPDRQPPQNEDPKPRRSVKIHLNQIKDEQIAKPVPHKGHTAPQR